MKKGKLRKCLKCQKPFWSRDFGNRICAGCNRENAKIRDLDIAQTTKPKDA